MEFSIPIADTQEDIKVFTTRIDTVFGMSYVVLAPEHPLMEKLADHIKNMKEVRAYVAQANKKSDLERTELAKEKTGVKLEGVEAVNPFNGTTVPIFIADYVLGGYGTGAVMAVPAHDERDFVFARKFHLSENKVVAPSFILGGINAPRERVETLERKTVSAIIEYNSKFLLLEDKENFYFVGGGIDGEESTEDAMRREIREETGYKNIEIKQTILDNLFCYGFRHTKGKNQKTNDVFYYVKLLNDEREEINGDEQNKHRSVWLNKDEVEKKITWEHHKFIWEQFLEPGPFTSSGVLVNSGDFTGLDSAKAREKMTAWLVKEKLGKKKVNYKLREWVFSRQRYWGEPIPIIHCGPPAGGCGAVAVPEKDLPVKLPEVKSYAPTGTGESPLADIKKWVNVKCPKCKGPAKRETNTMPQWAGSSWYYLRYIDPKNKKFLADKKKEKYWSPVDMYVGGAEHATRHLIYARFWHKFLYDMKAVNYNEPFTRLQNVGLIMAEDGRKMSKRYGNVINPDDIVKTYGADTLRLYEMFIGPFDQAASWNTQSIIGPRRFLERVWKLSDRVDKKTPHDTGLESAIHRTIKKVGEDIESLSFNTAISALMMLLNEFEKREKIREEYFGTLLVLLAPFAPHVAEELWQETGKKGSVHKAPWPKYDKRKLVQSRVIIAVQVNGKVRDTFEVAANMPDKDVEKAALAREKVKVWTAGKEVKRLIYVKGRLVNVVLGGPSSTLNCTTL